MQPATTLASLGMRKVKSTSNFAHSLHQQPQFVPIHSMHVSMAMPTGGLRVSPSMPAFPTSQPMPLPKQEPLDTPLPHITEERDDPLRLPDNVASMFLDDHDLAASDDLLNLMKDLHGHAPSALDLDLGLPSEPGGCLGGGVGGGASGESAGAAAAAAAPRSPAAPPHSADPHSGGLDAEPAASAPHSVDVLDPAFFNLDTDDHLGMSMLDDDFSSAFMEP